jgi:hypothetical protein
MSADEIGDSKAPAESLGQGDMIKVSDPVGITLITNGTNGASTPVVPGSVIEALADAAPAVPPLDVKDADRARLDETVAPNSVTRINDEHFMSDLTRLRELRSFLIQEAVGVNAADGGTLDFGRLNLLRRNYLPDNMGRDPTEEEWEQVERHTRILFGLLTPALQRRFVLGAIPSMLAWLPLALTLAALAALILAIVSYKTDLLHLGSTGADILPFYLIWLMAIGAIAFIGMNALSVQDDITFDLTNRRLIVMRIVLGALFGLVLTLPFGLHGFLDFCRAVVDGKGDTNPAEAPAVTAQAAMLVMPFIFGFSTSLVILILNRFVDAVQGFFGRGSGTTAAAALPPPPAART